MRMRKFIKKMAALGAGASMVGATIMGAVAADLNDWPQPFLTSEKKLDAFFVFGDNAAASDVAGAIDLATALQAQAVISKSVDVPGAAAGATATGGDAHMIGESSDKLEIREQISAVEQTLTDADLPTVLKSGRLSNSRGSTDYNQYIRFFGPGTAGGTKADRNGTIVYRENEFDEVADFLFWKDGDGIFEWELELTEGLESDVDSNNDLEDIEDMELPILGVPFTVVTSDISTPNKLELELMGGATGGTLAHGETASYELNGKTYTVTPQIFSSTSEVIVSGDVDGTPFTTQTLQEGETTKLPDGTTLGISNLLTSSKETVADTVKIFIGAGKIRFKDNDFTNEDLVNASGSTVEIDEETIEDARVAIVATNSSSRVEITSIKYRLLADAKKGDAYVPAGGKLRDLLDEPEGMLHDKWDIEYRGLTDPGESVIEITPSGDDRYKLVFENREGKVYSLDFVDNSSTWKYGDDDDDLEFSEHQNGTARENYNVQRNDYFVLTDQNNEKGFTRIYRYDSIDTSDKKVTFSDLAGGSVERTYTGGPGTALGNASGNIIMNGKTFVFNVGPSPDYNLSIDFDGSGAVDQGEANIVVKGGGILDLGNSTLDEPTHNGTKPVTAGLPNTFEVNLTTLSSEFDENPNNNEVVTFQVKNTDSTGQAGEIDIDLSTVIRAATGAALATPFKIRERVGSGDQKLTMTDYGVLIDEVDETNDPGRVKIHYPLAQRFGQVFITGEGVTFSEGGSAGQVTTQEVQRIQVGAAKLASEITDVSAQNLLVVGGPCANSVAASLMGNPANCAEGFEEGKALVKLYDTGAGNVALLVAGFSALDTRRASKAVAQGKLANLADGVKEATVTTVTDTPTVTVVA